jgi:hypothetical protein
MSIQSYSEAGPLDGSAAAGLLGEIFAIEMTSATITCDGCGASAQLGAARVYGGRMGAILRCTTCGRAVMRAARTPAGLRLDMRGTRGLFAHVPRG